MRSESKEVLLENEGIKGVHSQAAKSAASRETVVDIKSNDNVVRSDAAVNRSPVGPLRDFEAGSKRDYSAGHQKQESAFPPHVEKGVISSSRRRFLLFVLLFSCDDFT